MATFIICVLLSASVIGLTFIIERGLALRVGKIIPPAVKGAMETCRTTEDLPMLRRICQQHPSPLSRLLMLAERHRQWPRTENASALETSARLEISRLERGLVVLEIVVGVAPLRGLVGTRALNATLLGLLTAIPSLVAWSYYNKKVETLAIEMASLCDNFLRQVYRGEDSPEMAETPAREVS